MKVTEIKKGIYWVGADGWGIRDSSRKFSPSSAILISENALVSAGKKSLFPDATHCRSSRWRDTG